jgi:hypothetical protein
VSLKIEASMTKASRSVKMPEEKKRRRSSGPRNMKPTYLVYRGEDVEILSVSKDAFEILKLAQGDDSVKYIDVSEFMRKKTAKLSAAA